MSEYSELKFSNEAKIRAQMHRRNWTDEQVKETLLTLPIPAIGKKGSALRYIHPRTGKSVVVDAGTGEIFHVGGDGFKYE